MRLINRKDIEDWANSFETKGYLPIIIARLVRATTHVSTKINFPSGTGVFISGWDGIVDCIEDSGYVPKGLSFWEIGTEEDVKGKADDDYDARTKDPLGCDPGKSTFVFVTPRYWKFKGKWLKARKAEGIWKDIKVYDSEGIEQWLDRAVAVSRTFSAYLNKYPLDGIQTTDEFWEEWSKGPKCALVPDVVTAGRDFEKNLLFTFLTGNPSIKGVKASTKNEAIAFIIACAKQFEVDANELFFSKSLIVDTEPVYRAVRINNTSPLNLIPRFENYQPLYAAVSAGHHVIVPLGADDSFNQETITLPIIDRDGQIAGLVKSGLSQDESEKFSREAGRNITILKKKFLQFPDNRATWTKTEDTREIVPALLLGRWNEQKPGDRKLLETLASESYDSYLQKLNKWKNLQESPIIQIGETWRLVSPLDLWTTLSSQLSCRDFDKLSDCINMAFSNGNPAIESNSAMSQYFTPQRTFSEWSREGLMQSLILISHYGTNLQMATNGAPQTWVDNLLQSLLKSASSEIWISLNHEMPLIAEASPTSFLSALEESLNSSNRAVMAMFVEEESVFGSSGNYTGLLWALEALAWLPEYLTDATLLLARLAAADPGGKLHNRPINSLIEIFKPWHYRTLGSYEKRTQALEIIILKEPDVGWSFVRSLLPQSHDVARPTHKLRWRLFEANLKIPYTRNEVYQMYSFLVEKLLSIFDYTDDKGAQLVEDSVNLIASDRRAIIDFLINQKAQINRPENLIWHAARKVLAHHRTYPKANWALPESELILYQNIYDLFQPTDILGKYLWMFNEHWPEFPEGGEYGPELETSVRNRRVEAAELISKNYSIAGLIRLSKQVKEPFIFGDTLANVINDEGQILELLHLLNDKDKESLAFIHSFLFSKSHAQSFDWITNTFNKLVQMGFGPTAVGQFFVPITQSKQLWSLIESAGPEIAREYWLNFFPRIFHRPTEEKLIALEGLMKYNRFVSAMTNANHFAAEIPTELIIKILEGLVVHPTEERTRFQGYEIERMFEELDKRGNVQKKDLISLEWQYLSILASYGRRRSPKLLHQELATDPNFFMEVLRLVYKPKNKQATDEIQNRNPEQAQAMAHQAYRLLDSFETVPGFTQPNILDKRLLNNWVDAVRKLAGEFDRLEVADMQIGQILANYPETETPWPPDAICEVIERINTESIKRNFSSEAYNKRGSSTRGVFEGGDIERGHAEYFQQQAKARKQKFPIVSKILSDLAIGYLAQAKRMDEEAERERLEY